MQSDIQSLDFAMTDALAAYTRRSLGFGLTRHGQRIGRVAVRLGDTNGPRGGSDKFCKIQVTLIDAPKVMIEQKSTDMYAAIDLAVDRAARAVAKQVARQGNDRRGLRIHLA